MPPTFDDQTVFYSLEQLSHSSRKLCLKLLEFIAEFQDLPIIGGKTSEKCKSDLALPTKTLYFDGAKLRVI